MKTHRRFSSILLAVCFLMVFASQGALARKGKNHKPRKPASVEQTHKKAKHKKKTSRAPASVKKKSKKKHKKSK